MFGAQCTGIYLGFYVWVYVCVCTNLVEGAGEVAGEHSALQSSRHGQTGGCIRICCYLSTQPVRKETERSYRIQRIQLTFVRIVVLDVFRIIIAHLINQITTMSF